MARAYCLTCNHKCHCVGSGFYANTTECGCGCLDCTCKGLVLKLEEITMFKKIWKKIKEFFKRLIFWTR